MWHIGFNPYLAFAWSTLAGFIMSMGAGGGGILAGVGHITVLGIADPNMIKVVNQILELTSRVFSVPAYQRQRRIIWPLAASFGVGAPVGAATGSWLSKNYLANMATYRPLFGAIITLVALRVLYEAWGMRTVRNVQLTRLHEAGNRIRTAFQDGGLHSVGAGETLSLGPRLGARNGLRVTIHCAGESFAFNPLAAAVGGFIISFIGASLGVGGGFLVSPFMASILLFPMFLVSGTALVALMVPLLISIGTYLFLQVHVNWWLVGIEVPGIVLGSILGPFVNQRMNERALRTFVATVLIGIGCYYLS